MELFSKKLTPTDCLKRFSIPSRVLTSFPQFNGGHAVKLLVRYEAMEWPLVCTTRKKGRYKKPVISRGWRRFVLGNGLNVGDHLTFHKEEDDNSSSLHFRVELKKATNLSTSTTPCKSKSKYSKERERQVLNKQFCAIVTIDHRKGDHKYLKHFALSDGDNGKLANSNDQVNLRNNCNEKEKAVVIREHWNLDQSIHGDDVNLNLSLGNQCT
ncbi:hypothetical protein Gogos_018465 [Gossypium gossypioides]|uniref:TF-B3 domain-containing protein n=1 Tax=Gossypium gossypioides TaxID=34282 RepID=A0A7J9BE00_GOSGO|nr:hypothetical protein [Gossypium gossypioides]